MFGFLLKLFGGGVLNDLADQMRRAYEAKINATTADQKLAADLDMQRIEAAMRMAEVANDDRWSATSIGRYLIAIPFGTWYALIIADSIFAFEWDVLALPPAVMELSLWLFPAIIVGDLGKSFFKRRR
ncbi:MAG TPA: hypothetical protein VJ884_01320 [Salinibacter sp.]|nr:hypothetical protein [Salinibacter sp.]